MIRTDKGLLLALVLLATPWLLLSPRALGAQARIATVGTSSASSVEIQCGFEMPRVAVLRQTKEAQVFHLAGGVHEVAFSVVVGANTPWTLTVRPRPFVSARRTPVVEVRDDAGEWEPLSLAHGPVTVISSHPSSDGEPVRVVLRIRAEDYHAALQLVQFHVAPAEG